MSFSKSSCFLAFIVFTCVLIACQKEASYHHLEGTFHVKRTDRLYIINGNQQDLYTNQSDLSVKCTLGQNTLNVLGVDLPITSADQTEFFVDNLGTDNKGWIRVVYSDNYDAILIQYYITNTTTSNDQRPVSYAGKRGLSSELPNAGMATYDLWVEEKDRITGATTQYRKDVVVNHARSSSVGIAAPDIPSIAISLDNKRLDFRNFVSEAVNLQENVSTNNRVSTKERVYWENDSLYLEREVRVFDLVQGTSTLVESYKYKGRRK